MKSLAESRRKGAKRIFCGGTICLELWIPNSGGREGENASTFCCVGLAHPRGKRWRGSRLKRSLSPAAAVPPILLEIGEENISGGGEGHGFEDRVQNVSACAPHSSDVHKSAVEGCVSSISNHETSRQSEVGYCCTSNAERSTKATLPCLLAVGKVIPANRYRIWRQRNKEKHLNGALQVW